MSKYYKIYYSCGCGENEDYVCLDNDDEACEYAYQRAVEDYESYAGMHDIVGIDELIKEEYGEELSLDELDVVELDRIYTKYYELIDDAIDYGWEEITEEEYEAS